MSFARAGATLGNRAMKGDEPTRSGATGRPRSRVPGAPRRAWRDHPFLPAVVMLAVLGSVLAAFWPALSAEALYMDDTFYVGSPLLRQPSWATAKRIFAEVLEPSMVNGYYQPLALLSVMLDFLDPAATISLLPFHRTSLLLHVLNVALVVVLLAVLFGDWLAAGMVGLLYGLHPLNADVVLWVAERKTVLSACFALGSLLLYVSYARRARAPRGRDLKRYLGSLLLYACALLAKPTAVPLVALLLVLDYWPLGRLGRAVLPEKVPFLVLAGLSAAITVVSQAKAGHGGVTELMNPLQLPLVVAHSTGFYAMKLVAPSGLLPDYLAPVPFALGNPEVLVPVLGAAALAVAVGLSLRRTRAWLAGLLFFLVALSPTVGIVRFTAAIAANRSLYLPMVGLLLPLAWGLARASGASLGPLRRPGPGLLLFGAGTALALASATATRAYAAHWRDTLTLLDYALTQAPSDWRLHTRLGNEWIKRGDYPSAVAEFRQAVALNPRWTENRLNLGRALLTMDRPADAERALAPALAQTPGDWRAHMLVGTARFRRNALAAALAAFQTAARLAPGRPATHRQLGETLEGLGRLDEAAAEYREALRLAPYDRAARWALEALEARKAAPP